MAWPGPRPILELDEDDAKSWALDCRFAYLWDGRLYYVDPVGCVLCVEDGAASTLVSTGRAGNETFFCQAHGALAEIKYEMVKKYTVTIGGVVREGEEVVNDSMLFPASMSEDETNEVINRLLDEADQEENGVVVES